MHVIPVYTSPPPPPPIHPHMCIYTCMCGTSHVCLSDPSSLDTWMLLANPFAVVQALWAHISPWRTGDADQGLRHGQPPPRASRSSTALFGVLFGIQVAVVWFCLQWVLRRLGCRAGLSNCLHKRSAKSGRSLLPIEGETSRDK